MFGGGGRQERPLTLPPGVDRHHRQTEGSLGLEAGHSEGRSLAGHVDHNLPARLAPLARLVRLEVGLDDGEVEDLTETSVKARETGEEEGGLGLVTHRAVTGGVWPA